MKNVVGQSGLETETSVPVSLGANEKGGMDENEFANYLLKNLIMPLYSNVAPENRDV